MSFQYVQETIEQLLKLDRNDFIVITGAWGVGKTYFWRNVVSRLRAKDELGMRGYAYVSLFGVKDIETVKNLIAASHLENSGGTKGKVGKWWSSWTRNNVQQESQELIKSLPYGEFVPIGLASVLAFLNVKDSVICFDDLERVGDQLNSTEVLGLASQLKEERNCKIVFILNEGSFEKNELNVFRTHSEKLIDRVFQFQPTAETVFDYVFEPQFPKYGFVKQCCLNLDIRNARVLRRIKSYLEDLQPFLSDVDYSIADDANRSLILYVWSHYDNEAKPPSFEFLLGYSDIGFTLFLRGQGSEPNDEQKRWHELLAQYPYAGTDEVDKALMSFVQDGYLDKGRLEGELTSKNEKHIANQSHSIYEGVWKLFTEQFGDNEQEFVDRLIEAFNENRVFLSLGELKETAEILRLLNRNEIATKLIDEYFDAQVTLEAILAKDEDSYGKFKIGDSYIDSKLDMLRASHVVTFVFEDAIEQAVADRWANSTPAVQYLETQPVSKYYEFFKGRRGGELRRLIRGCLRYNNLKPLINSALRQIGEESRIDELRVKTIYGVPISEDSDIA